MVLCALRAVLTFVYGVMALDITLSLIENLADRIGNYCCQCLGGGWVFDRGDDLSGIHSSQPIHSL